MMKESSPDFSLRPVRPTRPAAGYIGGKRNLAVRVIARINAVPHTSYAEAFVGMGGIFLRRDRRPTAEFINDASGDIATFFRILQEHYSYLIDQLRFRVTSRAEFDRLLAIPAERLTDLQRAVRFLYVQRLAFGGKVAGRTFGVAPMQSARFNIARLEPMLADIHDRLAGVVIEQLPWSDFIRRYDRPGMLFYLDPPYRDSEDDYGSGMFAPADFAQMAAQLATIRGSFLLSINDHPDIRKAFAAFQIEEVKTTYHIGVARPAAELLISNRVSI